MATVREYFDSDMKALSVHAEWSVLSPAGRMLPTIIAKVALDLNANAKYWSFFLPHGHNAGSIGALFAHPETEKCVVASDGNGALVEMGFSDYSERLSSHTLIFTRRLFLYLDDYLGVDERRGIVDLGAERGFFVVIRDREYAQKRSEMERPLAFISHDSRDKDEFVRGLAFEMSKLMCPVWYDEYSLKVGDSLRANIEEGMKNTRNCILVLSPYFLSNDGWCKAEYDTVFAREVLEKKNVILPIWHRVSKEEVYQYSPRLSDRVGLSSSLGVSEVARRLAGVIRAH